MKAAGEQVGGAHPPGRAGRPARRRRIEGRRSPPRGRRRAVLPRPRRADHPASLADSRAAQRAGVLHGRGLARRPACRIDTSGWRWDRTSNRNQPRSQGKGHAPTRPAHISARPHRRSRAAGDGLASVWPGALQSAALAQHRSVSRRPRHRGGGRSRSAARLLHGRDGRRRLEDRRRRHHLGSDHRRLREDRLGRRDRGRAVGPERDLRRHGRGLHPQQLLARRRRLQVDRCRAARGSTSASPTHARSAGSPSTRRTPNVAFVAALGHPFGPNQERGLFRTRDGGATWEKVLFVDDTTGAVDVVIDPVNPRDRLRVVLARVSAAVGDLQRRQRQRSVQVGGRRQHVDRADERPADGHEGAHRPRRLAVASRSRVGDRRSEGRRRVPIGQRGRDLAADERRLERPRARVVLQPHHRRPAGRRHGLRADARDQQVDRRRPHVPDGARGARRQPRSVDRA